MSTISKSENRSYRRSLSLVLSMAAEKLFPDYRILLGYCIGDSYFYNIDNGHPDSKKDVDALKKEMLSIIDQNLPIEYKEIPFLEAEKYFEKKKLSDMKKLLETKCFQKVLVSAIGNFYELYQGKTVNSTGELKVFDLIPYGEGFMLQFPSSKDMSKIPVFEDSPKISEIFKLYKDWGKLVNVTCAGDINKKILDRKISDFINISETFQTQNYHDVAVQISRKPEVKVVLIAGPSSSGKTTSAKKLSLQLQALGYNPKVISLDNYYVNRDKTPKDEEGNYDYECLESLDVKQFNDDLLNLFNGKEINVPTYDFKVGARYYDGSKMKLEENDILVMEGIHGLNDKLTSEIPAEYKFKVYLSALTALNIHDHYRISTSDNRLIRRIVRDSKYRGKTAAQTISMWDSVQRGEQLYIFPFQNNADAVINTALDYELAVLKVYAEPLLECVRPDQEEYSEAQRLLLFLRNFSSLPEKNVPPQSIIREFIGGSAFKY